MWSILTIRPYLYGSAFNLRPDHEALRWVLNLADSSGRLARWRLRLAEYDYELQYRPGFKHQLADSVSRLRTDGGDPAPVDGEVPCFAVQYDEGSEALLEKVHWDLPQDRLDGCHALAITPEEHDAASISVEEFLSAQAEVAFCRFTAETVGTPNSKFDIDRYGFLVPAGWDPAARGTDSVAPPGTVPGTPFEVGRSPGGDAYVLYPSQGVLLAKNGQRRVLDRTELHVVRGDPRDACQEPKRS